MSDSGEDWGDYDNSDYEDNYENDDYYDYSLNIIDEYTEMYDNIEKNFMKPIKFADLPEVKKVFNKDNVNITNREGVSALMIAILYSSSEVVDYLINDCKADINYLNENDDNLFHILSDRGDNKDISFIFNILISKNIDINHINNDGHTPLSLITYYYWINNDILIKLYLQNGADPNILIQEDEGWTQLMSFIKEYNLKMFELLIKYGADLTHRDKYGTTPRILILTLIEQSICDGEKSIWGDMLQIIDNKLSS